MLGESAPSIPLPQSPPGAGIQECHLSLKLFRFLWCCKVRSWLTYIFFTDVSESQAKLHWLSGRSPSQATCPRKCSPHGEAAPSKAVKSKAQMREGRKVEVSIGGAAKTPDRALHFSPADPVRSTEMRGPCWENLYAENKVTRETRPKSQGNPNSW